MINPTQQKIRDKIITAKHWAEVVKSGEWIFLGSTGGSATACIDALSKRLGDSPGQVKNIEFWNQANFFPEHWLVEADPEQKYSIIHEFFGSPWSRKMRSKYGIMDWIPTGEWALGNWYQYYRFHHPIKEKRGIDWLVNATSPPEDGYFNFSYGTNVGLMFSKMAKKVVLEVRDDYPWAMPGANNLIHIDDVDYIVEVDCERYRWPQIKEAEPGEVENKIAERILGLMQDGDCIQLGIGALPTAVAKAIAKAGLKHLGIHTEMLQEGIMSLIEAGIVDGSLKNIDRGKVVWTFAFPFHWKRYYDFVHYNHSLAVYDINYTNSIFQLSRLDHMIAVDNFLAIDLLGQICCGYYNNRFISGTGGFNEFIRNCALSKGGRSIATASSRNKSGQSRVVSQLPRGSTVDVVAQFVQYVATEYGIVNLWGLSGYERAKALISIAHPDDRESLEREAYQLNLLPKNFPVLSIVPTRYPEYVHRRNYKIPYTSRLWEADWTNDVWSGE